MMSSILDNKFSEATGGSTDVGPSQLVLGPMDQMLMWDPQACWSIFPPVLQIVLAYNVIV
jgi:hypothetical protein